MIKAIHLYLWKKLKHSITFKIFLYKLIWLLPTRFRKPDLIWRKLNELSSGKRTVTFVNIGANDGLSGDPLIEFIFRKKWNGLLIEPVPYVFERLQKVYKGQPQVRCVNVAVAQQQSKRSFYYLEDTRQLPPGSDQIGSFDKAHLLKHESMFPNLQKYLKSSEVRCLTMTSLLKKYHLKKVDLYLIDTEGYDYEILKLIDLTNNKPELIIFEHQHLSKQDKKNSQQLLQRSGYTVEAEGGNTVASLST